MLRAVFSEGVRVFFIMGTGDVIAQTVVDKRELRQLDVERTLKFATIGLLFVGPALRIWYSVLDSHVAKNQPKMKRAFKKMALDQLLFAPVFTLALTGVVGKVNGESNEKIKRRIKNDYPVIMSRNYMIWPAAQMINFSVVPLQYQVVFAQLVAIIWNAYLSMMLNN